MASPQSQCVVLFPFRILGYQLGCTVAAVSAQRPVEHVKYVLQNIMTDRMPRSVFMEMRNVGYFMSVSKTLSQPQLRGVFLAANGRNWLLDRAIESSAPARGRASRVGFTAFFGVDATGACDGDGKDRTAYAENSGIKK